MFSSSVSESDSQATFYENAVNAIITSDYKMRKFRRIYNYREILEHVDFKLGKKYLDRAITLSGESCLADFPISLRDTFGQPWVYEYRKIGKISPTSLRYFAVTQELRARFGDPKTSVIAEIGAGYGGQYLALSDAWNVNTYIIYDLPEVQVLISKFISRNHSSNAIEFRSLDEALPSQRIDLVISNYAFSELPLKVQLNYIETVILKADRGYLIMNSGRTNHSGRSKGKITLQELQDIRPDIQVSEEFPKTGIDNYVISWGPRFE